LNATRQDDGRARRAVLGALACACLLLPACQQKMAEQPSYRKPLQPSGFFRDGRSARPIPAGTVARRRPRSDSPLVSYRRGGYADIGRALLAIGSRDLGVVGPLAPALAPAQGAAAEYVSAFPIRIDAGGLARGQERYTIFCAVCHGAAGTGHGKIVERGYLQPPNYATDLSRGFERRGIRLPLRDAPVGYFFEVVTRGFGGMPSYAEQIPAEDRWKIIAYVRALQLSQYAPVQALSASEQQTIRKVLEGKP
jgi:mono/diheme cytochrome c family protein